MIIYLVTNKITGKQYVGQTVFSVLYRWRQHVRWGTLVNPKSRFGYLHKAIHKHDRWRRRNRRQRVLGRNQRKDESNNHW